MVTAIDYALLSGDSYFDTRAQINRFPIPEGWERVSRMPTAGSGFEASAYSNGTEIVISFAGTYPTSPMDWLANSTLGAGVPGVDQLFEAAQYYLAIKVQYGDKISFTGNQRGQTRLICY